MPKPASRLDPLLRARCDAEAASRARHTLAAQHVRAARGACDQAAERLDRAGAQFVDPGRAGSLIALQAYAQVLERDLRALRQQATIAEAALLAAHAELTNAARQRAVLERLRDRYRSAAERIARAAEERERDERQQSSFASVPNITPCAF